MQPVKSRRTIHNWRFIDGSYRINENIIKALNKFEPPIFFTPGNHDYFQGLNEVFNAISLTKIQLLRNKVVQWA